MYVIVDSLEGLRKPFFYMLYLCGLRLYCVSTSGNTPFAIPLPIEPMKKITKLGRAVADMDNQCISRAEELLSQPSLKMFSSFFPGLESLEQKAKISLVSIMFTRHIENLPLKIWCDNNQSSTIIYVCTSLKTFICPRFPRNVKLIYLPFDILDGLLNYATSTLVRNATPKSCLKTNHASKEAVNPFSEKVAYIVHKGLTFGNLFDKNLYYVCNERSPFSRANILHVDYSGGGNLEEGVRWIILSGMGGWARFLKRNWHTVLRAILRCRCHADLFGVILLLNISMRVSSYRDELSSYTCLKLALIDYEVLCPKPLLLALEMSGIIRFATQERPLSPLYRAESTILDYYCCVSDEMNRIINNNKNFSVRVIETVGQYRTDKLVELLKRKGELRRTLDINNHGQKVIVALGFHASDNEYRSMSDPITSWASHVAFIEDCIALSKEFPSAVVVLRFKDDKWMGMPYFKRIIYELERSDSIRVYREYNRCDESYKICACADLVVAKPTSLAYECLAAGIPVLIHDYTHNSSGFISEIVGREFLKDIVCDSYKVLVGKCTPLILNGFEVSINDVQNCIHCLCGASDGKVATRVHSILDSLLN